MMNGIQERKRAAFFWLRLGLLVGLALAFWLTGAGAWLAGRVAGGGGAWGYGVFVALCVATYEALLFPVTRAANAALGEGGEGFGEWMRGYLLAMAVELGAVTAAAVAGRWLWLAMGRWWWAGGAAVYAVMSPDMWPVALWTRRERAVDVESPGWLGRTNAALARLGRRQAGGVAVYEPEGRGLRDMYFSYARGRTPTLVVVKEAWEGDGEDALVFGAVREGVRRRYRRWGRVVSAVAAAAVLWGAGRAAGAVGWEGGIGSAEAFPAMVVWLFSLASAAGEVRNWMSKRADGRAAWRACEALGGVGELEAWAEAAERRRGAAGEVPWWAEVLRRERAPGALAAEVRKAWKRGGKGRQG